MQQKNRRLRRLHLLLTAALIAAFMTAVPTGAEAQSGSYQKGPDPTAAALERDGPYTVRSTSASNAATPGFGGATIYYPVAESEGTFGGVVIFPGYTASQSSMAWLARRVASHGFVVLNADTNTVLDFPAARGSQMLDAIDYLRTDSELASMVDGDRIGVMGHSMGGGGSLEAIAADPSIDAAVPLTPWSLDTTWAGVTTPTLIIGAENDAIAPVASHSVPMYTGFSDDLEKAYVELNGASHLAPNLSNGTISLYSVSWMKRHVDGDARYTQFICPGPAAGGDLSDYRSDCDPDGGPVVGDDDPTPDPGDDPAPDPGTGDDADADDGRPWWCLWCWWL